MARKCAALPLKASTSSFQSGIDVLHGPHHVAQKSITATLPHNASKIVLASAGAWSTLDRFSGGAGASSTPGHYPRDSL